MSITVIEASAGTGKTHRVTSLAVEASPTGSRSSSCCSSPSPGPPPASCATGCGSGWWPPRPTCAPTSPPVP
jgi:hypothetical protein